MGTSGVCCSVLHCVTGIFMYVCIYIYIYVYIHIHILARQETVVSVREELLVGGRFASSISFFPISGSSFLNCLYMKTKILELMANVSH